MHLGPIGGYIITIGGYSAPSTQSSIERTLAPHEMCICSSLESYFEKAPETSSLKARDRAVSSPQPSPRTTRQAKSSPDKNDFLVS